MNRSLLGALLVASVVATPAVAAAGEIVYTDPSVPQTPTREEHYGFTILAVDLGSVAVPLVVGMAGADGDGLMEVSLGAYLLGGPIVHAAHGEGVRALGSLALRAGLPLAGAYGLSSRCEDNSWCQFGGVVLGGALGAGAAMVLDWTILSVRTVEETPRPVRSATFTAMPDVSVTPDGDVRVGMMGTF